jgi:hypothetical protein
LVVAARYGTEQGARARLTRASSARPAPARAFHSSSRFSAPRVRHLWRSSWRRSAAPHTSTCSGYAVLAEQTRRRGQARTLENVATEAELLGVHYTAAPVQAPSISRLLRLLTRRASRRRRRCRCRCRCRRRRRRCRRRQAAVPPAAAAAASAAAARCRRPPPNLVLQDLQPPAGTSQVARCADRGFAVCRSSSSEGCSA